jgi:hypothetical protein
MRRHVVPAILDFDYRANALRQEINPACEAEVRELHIANREQLIAGLKQQYGETNIEQKVADFTAAGPLVPSVIAYHNTFLLRQVRDAFASGCYYPALTGGCALGERILNHLMLDLRDEFRGTQEYKQVYRKDSFQDWGLAISTLEAWEVLVPEAATAFRELAGLRHRSLHFNPETYARLRDDALAASSVRSAPARGSSRELLGRPSLSSPTRVTHSCSAICPKVGPRFAWSPDHGEWLAFDFVTYEGEQALSDEVFRDSYNGRDIRALAPTMLPPVDGVVCYGLRFTPHPIAVRPPTNESQR